MTRLWPHRWVGFAYLLGLLSGTPFYGETLTSPGEPQPAPVEPVSPDFEPGDEHEVPPEDLPPPDVVAVVPPGVPLFERLPFNGQPNSPHWFNHDPEGKDSTELGQLVYLGTRMKGRQRHSGYDFSMPVGTPIYAPAAGTVVSVWSGLDSCPNHTPPERPAKSLRVLHTGPDGRYYSTLYLHLSEHRVTKGQYVEPGDLLALSGDTGCATGPHLHWGVSLVTDTRKMSGYAVDPFGWEGLEPDPHSNESVNLWVTTPPLYRGGVVVNGQ